MLRYIIRYCKPQNVQYLLRNRRIQTINVLNSNDTFFYPNLTSSFHSSTRNKNNKHLFADFENSFAYNVIFKHAFNSPKIKTPINDVTSLEEFNEILDQNWRDSTVAEVVNTFLKTKNFCIINDITISDIRFDKLVDGLMENCEHITDEDLINLIYCIAELPLTDSYSAHNFHDIWSCLDDICCWKIVEWDIDKCFIVANGWYKLHLGKLCDYIFILIDRNAKKAESLTKQQLINIYFYFNICRKRAVDFEYEFALERLINDMDIDEMAVIAMGYFKSKTKIKLLSITEALARKVTENTKYIEDISLTAILKILRYSKPLKMVKKIEEMTEKLIPEIDRLSDLSCTHLALLSTGVQTYNKTVLQKVSEKLVKCIKDPKRIRIKDMERILNVLTMFNFNPNTDPDIYKATFDEFHRKERLAESLHYPKCIASSLNYFSIKNMYSFELLDKILDVEYFTSVYGKGAKLLPREIFSLDCCVEIECPDYKGNRLPAHLRYKAVKWLVDYTPSRDQFKKLTSADKLIVDVIDIIRSIVGSDKLMYINHILPHFSRADIVVCKDRKTGEFVEPVGFQNYVLGDVMVPRNDDSIKWFAIVILGWNNTIKDTNIPLGHSLMKKRQLKTIGYDPKFVVWSEFQNLSTELKKQYVSNKLS